MRKLFTDLVLKKTVFENFELTHNFSDTTTKLFCLNVREIQNDGASAAHTHHMAEFWKEPKIRPMAAGRNQVGRSKAGTEVPLEISLVPVMIKGESYIVQGMFDVSFRRAESTYRLLLTTF